jgi:hypothetical protein
MIVSTGWKVRTSYDAVPPRIDFDKVVRGLRVHENPIGGGVELCIPCLTAERNRRDAPVVACIDDCYGAHSFV